MPWSVSKVAASRGDTRQLSWGEVPSDCLAPQCRLPCQRAGANWDGWWRRSGACDACDANGRLVAAELLGQPLCWCAPSLPIYTPPRSSACALGSMAACTHEPALGREELPACWVTRPLPRSFSLAGRQHPLTLTLPHLLCCSQEARGGARGAGDTAQEGADCGGATEGGECGTGGGTAQGGAGRGHPG